MQKLFHADSAGRNKNEPIPPARKSPGGEEGSGSASRKVHPHFRPINLTINFNNFGRGRATDKQRASSPGGSSVSTIIRHKTKRRKGSDSRSRSNEHAPSEIKDIKEINE